VAGRVRRRIGKHDPREASQGVSQDCVDEPVPARGQPLCRVDGLVDGGIGGNLLREAHLVECDAEDVPDAGLQRRGLSPVEAIDQEIQQAPHAQCAVDEERQQPAVGFGARSTRREDAVEQGLGEGALPVDAVEDLDGEGPGVVFQLAVPPHPRGCS